MVAQIPTAASERSVARPEQYAAEIAEHFHAYNEEFGRITRRAAANFLTKDRAAAQRDAVTRIELYEFRVAACVTEFRERLGNRLHDIGLWSEIKGAYDALIAG